VGAGAWGGSQTQLAIEPIVLPNTAREHDAGEDAMWKLGGGLAAALLTCFLAGDLSDPEQGLFGWREAPDPHTEPALAIRCGDEPAAGLERPFGTHVAPRGA